MVMKKALGISVIGVAMLVQLMLLPTRSMFVHYYGADRPRMTLPIADNTIRDSAHIHEEISWTRGGGWVAGGGGSIKGNDLEAFLKAGVERCEGMGIHARIRVRIPADASAQEFVHLAMCMERAGVKGFNVAVTEPGAPWI